jgi:hypothetical protein
VPNKFPIGSRVGGKVLNGATHKEVPMRVLGYDGLKGVIVEFLEDHGPWKKGQATLISAKSLTLREEVKFIRGEPEDDNGPAIGWLELGHLSVALTRDTDGALLVSLERAIIPADEESITVRVRKMPGSNDLWEGDI